MSTTSPRGERAAGVDGLAALRADVAVEISLNALVERIDDHLFERGTRDFRAATGLSEVGGPFDVLEELTRPDTFQYIGELIDSPRTDEAKRARLVLLRRFVAEQFVEARTAVARRDLERWRTTHQFEAAASSWSIPGAVRELPRQPNRETRVVLERELSATVVDAQSRWARLGDETLQAMSELKAGLTPAGFTESLHGRPLPFAAAQQVLHQTNDAYLDLLGFVLKRVDPQLTRRTASAHDVDRAALAPWLTEWFRAEDLEHAVTRCLGDLALSVSAEGRITVDLAAPKAGRTMGATVAELRVPDQIRLVLTRSSGLDTYATWLAGWGVALQRAHVNRAIPLVERRLGDRSVIDAMGWVFRSFLLEEGWLKRYLRLTQSQAREASRVVAFTQLLELRCAAAALLTHQAFLTHGATASLVEVAVPCWSHAMGCEVPRGRTFTELDRWGASARVLDAISLEQVLHGTLLERFNEDFYRNPATGRWLTDLASRGQRDDAVALATVISGAPEAKPEVLSLTAAGARRIAHMGA